MASEATIKEILTKMLSTYPQSPDGKGIAPLTAIWVEVLSDIPDALIEAAASDYLRSDAAFRPAPGQLRSLAMRISDGDADAKALAAWEAVLNSDFGRDLTGVDETARRVMRMIGGFEGFANSRPDDEHFWRERFVKLYASLAQRQDGRALIGNGNISRQLRLVGKTK